MKVTRTLWKGNARYSNQLNGAYFPAKEALVMVQAFDDEEKRLPYFKAAYLDGKGKVTTKLSFHENPDLNANYPPVHVMTTEQFLMSSAFDSNPNKDPAVGALNESYPGVAAGLVRAWTNRGNRLFQTWNYIDYWGAGYYNVFTKQLDLTPVYVNGQGHTGGSLLIRTMCYSARVNGIDVPLFMKSSVLKRVKVEMCEHGFRNFVD